MYKSSLSLCYLPVEWIIKHRALTVAKPPTRFPCKKWAQKKEVLFISNAVFNTLHESFATNFHIKISISCKLQVLSISWQIWPLVWGCGSFLTLLQGIYKTSTGIPWRLKATEILCLSSLYVNQNKSFMWKPSVREEFILKSLQILFGRQELIACEG